MNFQCFTVKISETYSDLLRFSELIFSENFMNYLTVENLKSSEIVHGKNSEIQSNS